jgi:hypothetical protein
MKKGRSNKFTVGLCNTFTDCKNLRTLFFELDKEHLDQYSRICKIYDDNKLDYFIHKTGSGGYHFISPTMITKERWKNIMNEVKDVNPKCPMTTLRMQPNKYFGEDSFWYFIYIEKHFDDNYKCNSKNMSDYLNHIFKTKFDGLLQDEIKIVRYPLPKVEVQYVGF